VHPSRKNVQERLRFWIISKHCAFVVGPGNRLRIGTNEQRCITRNDAQMIFKRNLQMTLREDRQIDANHTSNPAQERSCGIDESSRHDAPGVEPHRRYPFIPHFNGFDAGMRQVRTPPTRPFQQRHAELLRA
jgi:hypothetical protein